MKLTSWNVNGIRASMEKGLRDYLTANQFDIVCLQEVKAERQQVGLDWLDGYRIAWNPAVKKGYSGTAVFSRLPFETHIAGMNLPEHDNEGRVITLEFEDFFLVNVYTPNAQEELKRLPYRIKWDQAFRHYLEGLGKKKPVFACGDFNVAHQEIDIARPKENRRNPGFSDEEREGFTRLLDAGFVDAFRRLDPRPEQYTWWSYRANARANNVGWRIDYWLVSDSVKARIAAARIRQDIHGSDHCPVELDLQ